MLDDLIAQSREDAGSYEAFLKRAEELAKKLVKKTGGDYPSALHGRTEAIVIYRNLPSQPGSIFRCPEDAEEKAELALKLDLAMREHAPAGWKGDQIKERLVQNFLHKLVQKDPQTTIALFEIVKNQPGYG